MKQLLARLADLGVTEHRGPDWAAQEIEDGLWGRGTLDLGTADPTGTLTGDPLAGDPLDTAASAAQDMASPAGPGR